MLSTTNCNGDPLSDTRDSPRLSWDRCYMAEWCVKHLRCYFHNWEFGCPSTLV